MATYRLYRLDGAGKVASAEWVDEQDDDAALAAADRLHEGRAFELWQNGRLVAKSGSAGRRS